MTAPVAFDPITQVHEHAALWHADPVLEALVRDIFERAKPDMFIETGTHMGWTSRWVALNYPDVQIRTVEIDARFLPSIAENLGEFGDRVEWSHDDSINWLWKLRPWLRSCVSLFFLDAHWHPPVPLREECRIIASMPHRICLIDDFQCWAPDFNGDTFYTRPSLDYTKTGAEGGGDKYHNDLSYIHEAFGACEHWRPCYQPQDGSRGVGLFTRGSWYEPPQTWRSENRKSFLRNRPATAYPLHPSMSMSLT